MKYILFVAATLSSVFAFADSQVYPPRVSKDCSRAIYQFVKPALEKGQWAQDMMKHVDAYGEHGHIVKISDTIVDIFIVKDQGDKNYCTKTGQVEVKFYGDSCTPVRIISTDDDGQFDCG